MQDALAILRAAQDELFAKMLSDLQTMVVETATVKGINILSRAMMYLDMKED